MLTIPRLELMSAKILSSLIARIAPILNISKSNVYLFLDSTTVLSWLKILPNKLKSFVSNRISFINEKVN